MSTNGQKLSAREIVVLEVLRDHYERDGNCLTFAAIGQLTDPQCEQKNVRRVTRSLARKGLAEFVRGLFDDEGQAAGSGYCCTPKGRDLFDGLSK